MDLKALFAVIALTDGDMSKTSLIGFLSRLLNRDLDENASFSLSSAQRARLIAWLQVNGLPYFENYLQGNLTVNNLLGSAQTDSPIVESSIKSLISTGSYVENSSNTPEVGIDIQWISEVFPDGLPDDPKASEELTKIFNLTELSYAQASIRPIETLVGIFAAKEAILKAGGNKNLREIEVLPDENGVPRSRGYSLSISHSGEYAVAFAISHPKPAVSKLEGSLDVAPLPVGDQNVLPKKSNWKRRVFDLLIVVSISILFFIVLVKT